MIIDASNLSEWQYKGHQYGECMSHWDSEYMYVYIPKNASSWTKPNLKDFDWQFYNYHADNLKKHALVVVRDPVERWLSGIAEYFTLYHPTFNTWTTDVFDLTFDRVCFDDHTERQIKFLHELDTDNCTFFKFDNYREDFSQWINEHYGENKYDRYEFQHVSDHSPERKKVKEIFKRELENSKYLEQIKNFYAQDYKLINSVKYYGSR